uniref:Uncharacterized protein n=2 Tax=Tetraselmis sp. GSL018 TaxID=582737 RepID=A0A061SGG9_9CHLO|mmetsp:Transcript_34710/g.82321  ORF Transcript_34710/g.82321 Transcript_34710/m.82321 type:complete len:170 (+) Transcript_34710:191-700(+)
MQTVELSNISKLKVTHRRICCSLFLQQLVYYNIFYSIFWSFTKSWLICSRYYYDLSVRDPDEVRTIMMVFFFVSEPLRLWSGFAGNLYENVPLLAFFWILTLFPSTLSSLYLLLAQKQKTPIDTAIQLVMTVFVLLEILYTPVATWRMLRLQRVQFYLHDLVRALEGHR